jgi:hypothetical protein
MDLAFDFWTRPGGGMRKDEVQGLFQVGTSVFLTQLIAASI